MEIAALDIGLRGAAAGLFLLIAIALLRDRPAVPIVLITVALDLGGVVFAITNAPLFPQAWKWWTLPFLAGTSAVFWLWAQAAFDDDFVFRPWYLLPWIATVALGLFVSLGHAKWPTLAAWSGHSLSLASIALALAATAQTVRTWRADLVAGRRRLRVAVLCGNLIFIALSAGSDLASPPSIGIAWSLGNALGLCVMALMIGWLVLQVPVANPDVAPITTGKLDGPGAAGHMSRAGEPRPAIAPALLRRLDTLMTVERVYRQEGLTIGGLAAKLGLPEYRLRQVINEGLGHRNFNAFLNRYRIEEAKAALADPDQREVPVLTIAMDAGFQSIGPFNRAFKAATDLTPTEFRRDALARSSAEPLESGANFGIGKPG